jgi:hypothetical protein
MTVIAGMPHHMTPPTFVTIATRVLAGAAMLTAVAAATVARAEDQAAPPSDEQEQEQEPAEAMPANEEPPPDDIDFNALATALDQPYTPSPKLRGTPGPANAAAAWSRNDRPNGTAAVSVKQPVSPFWDMKAGVDLDVATQASPLRTPDTLPDKLAADSRVEHSQAAAWMTAKAPGVPYLSDHVALEARMNPSRDARLGTSFSKSLPLFDEQASLTLRHGYYVTQHDAILGASSTSGHGRSVEMERGAELKLTDTGTSFLAGQSLRSSGDRWLNSVGAQQKLFGGLSITGTVSETEHGFSNKRLGAQFKKSW